LAFILAAATTPPETVHFMAAVITTPAAPGASAEAVRPRRLRGSSVAMLQLSAGELRLTTP